MIGSLINENFQSHQRTEVEFGPGINAIVGASDKGKSALLRSLRWVISNKPTGEAFISDWAFDDKGKQTAPCRTTMLTNGHKIERLRYGKQNEYRVDGVLSEAFRTDVPEAVTAAFNLAELNFQSQLDGPFLLSQSGGEVARFFNGLVKLEDIDQCMSAADSMRLAVNRDIKAVEVTIEEAKRGVESLEWVDGTRERLEALKRISLEKANLTDRHRILRALLERRTSLAWTRDQGAWVPSAELSLLHIRDFAEQRADVYQKWQHLNTRLTDHRIYSRVLLRVPLIERAQQALTQAQATLRGMVGLSTRLDTLDATLRSRSDALKTVTRYSGVLALAPKLQALTRTMAEREDLSTLTRGEIFRALQKRAAFSSAKLIHDKIASLDITKLKARVQMRLEKEARRVSLVPLIERRNRFYNSIEEFRRELETLRASLPKVCPTCHKPYGADCET